MTDNINNINIEGSDIHSDIQTGHEHGCIIVSNSEGLSRINVMATQTAAPAKHREAAGPRRSTPFLNSKERA